MGNVLMFYYFLILILGAVLCLRDYPWPGAYAQ